MPDAHSASMPEDARDCAFDPEEDYPWDCDLQWPFEGDDEGDDEDEGE